MPVVIPFIFATRTGNVPASNLDDDFSALAAFSNTLEAQIAALELAATGLISWGPSAQSFGAVGDGVTNDTGAITAANITAAAGTPVWMQAGNYLTTIVPTLLDGRFWGSGQIIDVDSFKRGPWFSAIKAAPTSREPFNITEWFTGDISHVQIAMEHRVTGVNTLGSAAPGFYDFVTEASAIGALYYNDSGQMSATVSADRTAASFMNLHVTQAGKGDVVGLTIGGVLTSPNPNADVLLGPNLNLLNGGITTSVDGCVLIVSEFRVDDGGFDIGATGHTVVLARTNATGAKNAYWYAFRGQSVGSQPVDALFSGFGPTRIGIDLSGLTTQAAGTWVNAAITLSGDDRIYLNATPGAPPLIASNTGSIFLTYDSGSGNIAFVHTGVSILQLNAVNAGITGGLVVSGAVAATTITASGTLQGAGVVATGGLTLVGKAVTEGAIDSGGAGFRQLRVPN